MLEIDNSLIIMVDMQDRLLQAVRKSRILEKAVVLAKACHILGIPIVITEQYPKGLGHTTQELVDVVSPETQLFEKVDFSALRSEEIAQSIDKKGKKQIILCGVETHICVFQTAVDLLQRGYEVYLLQDISSSRFESDEETALAVLSDMGVGIWSLEMLLFDFLKSADHPSFKAIQSLIK